MALDPLCVSAKVLGHSWGPTGHWWLSLTAADQGAWVSGMGALVASVVAVSVALHQHRKAEIERERRAVVTAAYLFSTIGLLKTAFQAARTNLENAMANPTNRQLVYACFCMASRGMFEAKHRRLRDNLSRLSDFPAGFGVTLATVPTIIEALRSTFEYNVSEFNAGRLSLPDLVDQARIHRNQVLNAEANLGLVEEHYGSKFVG